MTEEELAAIKARADAATPGPWADLAETYRARLQEHHQRTKKWWHGTRAWSLPVVLIARARDRRDEPFTPDDIPERVDWHDLQKVIGWRWGMLPRATTSIAEGFLSPQDAAFIAGAREDIPALLAEIERLQARARAQENHPAMPRTPG